MDLREFSRLYDFTGRSVVITGGTGVLFSTMARGLVGCGADVAIVTRSSTKGASLISTLPGPGRAVVAQADVLKRTELQQALQTVIAEFGRIDCLINGAGGNQPNAITRSDLSFFDLPEDALRFVFDLNMLGTILPTQVFGKTMAGQGEGVVLNVSSMSAFRPLTRVLGYSAAKAGVNNFTQWLAVYMAREYSPRIRVNAIAPGFFLTEQNRNLLTEPESGRLTERGQSILDHTPMGRFGQPEDLLGTVLWLLSPASAFVTGVVVPVDGGFSAFSGV
jgi:NAD(P)-dependent dehydrogenase (short-subunit alcohol dehydrogenase family)